MSNKEKKRMITMVFILILIVILISVIIILRNKEQKVGEAQTQNKAVQSDNVLKEIADRGWDKYIVNDVFESVPIPQGYKYESGDKTTGMIIQEEETGVELLWIPYNDFMSTQANDYYSNVSYYEMESDVMDSIKKYNGFYVYLEMNANMDELKNISADDYENYAKQLYVTSDDTINTHILYKEEIAQINKYLSNDSIYLGDRNVGIEAAVVQNYSTVYSSTNNNANVKTSNVSSNGTNSNYKIEKLADTSGMVGVTNGVINDVDLPNINNGIVNDVDLPNINNGVINDVDLPNINNGVINDVDLPNNNTTTDENTTTTTKEDSVYMLKSAAYTNEVPIPSGYKYNQHKQYVSIQNAENKNLVYIWVPVTTEGLQNAKSELKKLYENYTDANGEKFSFDKDSELYSAFEETSETIPDALIKSIEKYNGFYISEAELGYDSEGLYYNKARGMVENSVKNTINGGDYFRSNANNGNIMSQAQIVSAQNKAISSDIVYGALWDATVLWIKDTNSSYVDKDKHNITDILIANSTNCGKYKNSGLGDTATAEQSSVYFNGIWGLGGNLSEITPERSSSDELKSYILRGGNYSTTGEETPIASRKLAKDTNTDTIGFRTCLYVTPDLPVATESVEKYNEELINDTVIFADEMKFKLCTPVEKYVSNWDGIDIYESPNTTSNKISTLGFASKVTVIAKATENSNNVSWVKIKLEDGTTAFMDEKQLTTETTKVGNYDFVLKDSVNRFYNKEVTIYEEPDESSKKIKTTSSIGLLSVLGKSTNSEWAYVSIDNKKGYLKAANLIKSETTEVIGGVTFAPIDSAQRYINKTEGASIYSSVDKAEAVATCKYATQINITATSIDGAWKVANYNGTTGVIEASSISIDKPADLPKPQPTTIKNTGNSSSNNSSPSSSSSNNSSSSSSSSDNNSGGTNWDTLEKHENLTNAEFKQSPYQYASIYCNKKSGFFQDTYYITIYTGTDNTLTSIKAAIGKAKLYEHIKSAKKTTKGKEVTYTLTLHGKGTISISAIDIHGNKETKNAY